MNLMLTMPLIAFSALPPASARRQRALAAADREPKLATAPRSCKCTKARDLSVNAPDHGHPTCAFGAG